MKRQDQDRFLIGVIVNGASFYITTIFFSYVAEFYHVFQRHLQLFELTLIYSTLKASSVR
jgi:hypothetical protein